MKENARLYNIIFPIWLLWVLPPMWLFILPANFVIDFLVLSLSMKRLGIAQAEVKAKTKTVILKTWVLGFVADIIGSVFMYVPTLLGDCFGYASDFGSWWQDALITPAMLSPFDSVFAVLWVLICILIAGVCIYFFNYKICFKSLELEPAIARKLALSMAIFTAPYLFLLPTTWFV